MAKRIKRPPVPFAIIGVAFIFVEQRPDGFHIIIDTKEHGTTYETLEAAKEQAEAIHTALLDMRRAR